MKATVEQHFSASSLPVRETYDAIVTAARSIGPFEESPKKTSIHLNRRTAFAGIQTRKNHLILTLKSDKEVLNRRISKSQQTSANRWHLDVRVENPTQVDHELIGWLQNAYALSG